MMEKDNASLRDINLKLKGSGHPLEHTDHEPPRRSSGPMLIRTKFFLIGEGEPYNLFNALLYTIPSRGDIFEMGDDQYQVIEIRRVLGLMLGEDKKTREAYVRVFVMKYHRGKF
jgi:hypothetical protein